MPATQKPPITSVSRESNTCWKVPFVGWRGRVRTVLHSPLPKCQDGITLVTCVCWPILSLNLPNGPGVIFVLDCFQQIAVTARGN